MREEREAVVTAKMLHEAFSKETELAAWTHLSHEAVRRFDRMAHYCNEQLEAQRECIAADEHFESDTAEEPAQLEVESLVFLSRQEAEKITRSFLLKVNGFVDEAEVARIMALASEVQG